VCEDPNDKSAAVLVLLAKAAIAVASRSVVLFLMKVTFTVSRSLPAVFKETMLFPVKFLTPALTFRVPLKL